MHKKLLIAILAAGASRRLGSPKQLLRLANETLLHRQCRIALESKLGSVVAILGCDSDLCRAAIADLPVEIAINSEWQEGMSSSVRKAAQLSADGGYDGMIIMLVDQYQLICADLLHIAKIWDPDSKQIVLSVAGDYQGPPVLFGSSYFADLQILQCDHGAKDLLRKLPAKNIQKVTLLRAAADCDQAEDLSKLELELSHESVSTSDEIINSS